MQTVGETKRTDWARRYLLAVLLWEAALVALLSPLSATGPLAGLGLADRLGLSEAGRVGRIVMLYHSLAIPFLAALVYLILDALPFEEGIVRQVRPAITAGYLLTSVGGLSFAYLHGGWIAHGVFLVGLSLVFYAGVALWLGLSPWREWDGRRLERWAFWLMALYTLLTAVIGGATASFFGNGFQAFLAEDVVRLEHTLGQEAIIAHLHAMLMLLDVALLLLIGRAFRLEGRAYRASLGLTVAGTTIATFATWSVMVIEFAHKIINVGVFLLLISGGIVAVWGFARPSWTRRAAGRGGWRALLGDPIRFGLLFELLFVNLVVSLPGIWVAVHLDAVRQGDFGWERTIAVGHWHVLATLSAVIGLFLVVDRLGVRGWLRQVIGWGVLVGSSLAFIFVQFYMFRQPGEDPGRIIPFIDAGIGLFLAVLAVFLGTYLANLRKERVE